MLIFKTNFNKTNLLRERHRFFIVFEEEEPLYFTFPTFGELYDRIEELDSTLYLLTADPEKFVAREMGFVAKNTFELFWGIMKFSPFYAKKITVFFEKYFEGSFVFKEGQMFINDVTITEDRFNILKLMIAIATGEKDFSEWINFLQQKDTEEKEIDELSKSILEKMRRNEEKVKKTKEGKNNNNKTDIDIIMLSIVNEIPSISLNDIFNMNYFTFMWYYSNINKLVENKIQIVAAGNGLVKNFNYLT